jgi:hypothetical protein
MEEGKKGPEERCEALEQDLTWNFQASAFT